MRRGQESPGELLERAMGGADGDRRSLARLVSIVERGGPAARELTRLTYAKAGSAYSVGITGAPGSGKSTLTGQLVAKAREETDDPVAVLAIDPTSPLSGGAILGDRIRMQEHALDERVFIRSMATRGHLGGLAAAVPDAVRLLDACGWPLVLVETVGVGQVEVEVASTCDTVVVVLNPGWGDSVQANKAGLLEVADVLVINKADRAGFSQTRRDLVHMLQLGGKRDWTPPIVATIAPQGTGVDELWRAVSDHRRHLETSGRLSTRRDERATEETQRLAVDTLAHLVRIALGRSPRYPDISAALAKKVSADGQLIVERLRRRELDPSRAASELLALLGSLFDERGTQLGSGNPG